MRNRPNRNKYKEFPKIHKCNYCEIEYPFTLENFSKASHYKFGLSYTCKNCESARKSEQDRGRRSEINKIKQAWAAKNKSEGLCEKCNSVRLKTSNNFCEKHYYQNLSYKALGTKKDWQVLKLKLEAQNFKCAYSGIDLVLGVNASIDHVHAIAKKGAKIEENIVWADVRVNRMKRDMHVEEFIDLCKRIAETAPTPS